MAELFLRNSYVEPIKEYDTNLKLTEDYTASLPDMQDASFSGARVFLPHVGIHNFRLPLRIARRRDYTVASSFQEVEASITGTVSLDANKKGINMSRIIRTFYEEHQAPFTIRTLVNVLKAIMLESDSNNAYLMMRFNYPIKQNSLRTGMSGYQYYEVCFTIDMEREDGSDEIEYTKSIDFDFVYSSACPCSYELAEHARKYRNVATVSHSQRSVARLSLLVDNNAPLLYIEDIQEMCIAALHTETQVMVKRPDEQAFAELNGTYTKFVEDAARQLYQVLDKHNSIKMFRVICSHLESLHSHDAIAVVQKGDYFSTPSYHELRSLVK